MAGEGERCSLMQILALGTIMDGPLIVGKFATDLADSHEYLRCKISTVRRLLISPTQLHDSLLKSPRTLQLFCNSV